MSSLDSENPLRKSLVTSHQLDAVRAAMETITLPVDFKKDEIGLVAFGAITHEVETAAATMTDIQQTAVMCRFLMVITDLPLEEVYALCQSNPDYLMTKIQEFQDTLIQNEIQTYELELLNLDLTDEQRTTCRFFINAFRAGPPSDFTSDLLPECSTIESASLSGCSTDLRV